MTLPSHSIPIHLNYSIYRDSTSTNEAICKEIIEEIKDFVFEGEGIVLSSQGYSGVPLHGCSKIASSSMDLWKTLDVLFKLSEKFPGSVFSISTKDEQENPFYIECEKNEVIPLWAKNAAEFTHNVFGMNGVLHCVHPDLRKQNPRLSQVEILRQYPRETRNILITEAVKQQVHIGQDRRFGMHRLSVNLPERFAYIARQRPDLLAVAINEFEHIGTHSQFESQLEQAEKVMVHVEINSRDCKIVTAVADIDGPCDIVSHRLGIYLFAFDAKYASCQNGELLPENETYSNMEDDFERERLVALAAQMTGKPLSLAHQYQVAVEAITEEHRQICRNIFNDDVESSTDQPETCSGDDEDPLPTNRNKQRKQILKKKRGDVGKKRTLAAVLPFQNNIPTPHDDDDDDDLPTPTSSGQLKNFERAVNGDDVFYKESTDEKSLGEEEELEFFAARSKKADKKSNATVRHRASGSPLTMATQDADCGFDVSEFLNVAPPLATNDEFDDI